MIQLTNRNQLYLGVLLTALMLTTRSHHFASLHHLPDASWAVFFLAGVYLRPMWLFPVLCASAAGTDYVAITWGGVSSFCVTGAYIMLLPAYGSLWLGGRWYATRHADQPGTLLPLVGILALSTLSTELLSSGGFYFLSGRFVDPTFAEFGSRLAQYFPHNLWTVSLYVALAVALHAGFVISIGLRHQAAKL